MTIDKRIFPPNFFFQEVSRKYVKKEMKNLNVKRSSTNGFIPVTILKRYGDVYLPFLIKAMNLAIIKNIFIEQLK